MALKNGAKIVAARGFLFPLSTYNVSFRFILFRVASFLFLTIFMSELHHERDQ